MGLQSFVVVFPCARCLGPEQFLPLGKKLLNCLLWAMLFFSTSSGATRPLLLPTALEPVTLHNKVTADTAGFPSLWFKGERCLGGSRQNPGKLCSPKRPQRSSHRHFCSNSWNETQLKGQGNEVDPLWHSVLQSSTYHALLCFGSGFCVLPGPHVAEALFQNLLPHCSG